MKHHPFRSRGLLVTVVAALVVATAGTAWALHGPAASLLGASSETDCDNTNHETPDDVAKKITGMTPDTQRALATVQEAARRDGITLTVNSGYRSAAYQQRVYDCWVRQLGSPTAARQRALPPQDSAHVAGYAMDVAPQKAAKWLEKTGGGYGFCRRYGNEAWHFEFQKSYRTDGCPQLLPQP